MSFWGDVAVSWLLYKLRYPIALLCIGGYGYFLFYMIFLGGLSNAPFWAVCAVIGLNAITVFVVGNLIYALILKYRSYK